MFLLARPTPDALDDFLLAQRGSPYAYRECGATRDADGRDRAPTGYTVDHNRVCLGAGADTFARATAAVRAWQMFALGWCAIHPADATIAPGTIVAAVVHHFGFWSVNASRIVYTLDEHEGPRHRYGFAYGTLPAHGEVGEERFTVEWNREDDSVWYDLYAFSRPGHLLARLGYPLVRRLQRTFARDSLRAMAEAVSDSALIERGTRTER